MSVVSDQRDVVVSGQQDVIWKDVWVAFGIGFGGTLVLSGILFAVLGANMWLLALLSMVALAAGGYRLGSRTGRWEGIAATLVAILYFAVAALVIIVGFMFEVLPDPLPGLPKGNSTFYFVWPLLQLASVIGGSVVGQRVVAAKIGPKSAPQVTRKGVKRMVDEGAGSGGSAVKQGGSPGTWALVAAAGVLAVVGIILAARPKPAQVVQVGAPAQEQKVKEFVPGIKRWTGVFKGEGTKVIKAEGESLEKADVTFDVEVARAEYKPSEFKVKKGQVVKFRLMGLDSGLADMPELKGAIGLSDFSGHGFHITGPYDVYITGIRKDVTKEVVFKATEAGEFTIECVVFCSPDHYLMRGKLIVEE